MPIYLDIPGIPGESAPNASNPNWQNKIDVKNWSTSVTLDTSMEVGTGLVSSGSRAGHFHFTKTMDKSTPLLFANLCSGDIIPKITIRETQAGAQGGTFEGETYVLENVIVSHYTTSGSQGMGGMPEEHWSFAYTKRTDTYQTTDEQGNKAAAVTVGFDFAQGVQTT